MRTMAFKDFAAYYGAEAAAEVTELMLERPGPLITRLQNPKCVHRWPTIMEGLWLRANYGWHDQDWPDEWRPSDNVRIVPETAAETPTEVNHE